MNKDFLNDILNEDESQISDPSRICNNSPPSLHGLPYRLAIIGEAPGEEEIEQGKPFVGYNGRELDRFLSRFGILRDACFVGNVCNHRPPGNKIALFDWNGPEITSGLERLKNELTSFKPNCVLLLGGSALHAFKNPSLTPKKRKDKDGQKFIFPDSISDWRGSFFLADDASPCPGVKCIAAYHPAACLRQYEWTPLLMMDIQRAFSEATTKELVLPEEEFDVELNFEKICKNLDDCYETAKVVATDIEGYWNDWKCISFAVSSSRAFIVPFVDMQRKSLWSVDQETRIFQKVTRILSAPHITKIWQNGLYDRFVLQYGYNIVVRGPSHDTMLKWWELYCELPKALSVQTSILTKRPFYKQDISSQDQATFWRYCCRDSAVTFEIDQKLDRYLDEPAKKHYQFNLTLLNALLYMELRGIRYNKEAAKARLKEVQNQIYELQHELDTISGYGLRTKDKTVIRALIRDRMCTKRDSSVPLKEFADGTYDRCMRLALGEGELSKSEMGELSTKLGLSLNIKSKTLKDYLYGTLNLPIQKDPQTGATTTDYEALLTLSKKSTHPSIRLCIDIGELRTRAQMLGIATDPDGRIRSSYNEVGSETGRVTSGTSPTGSGYNLQTIPDENTLKPVGHPLRQGMRDLLLADNDCYLAKCDLKGADGWTIGANLASLGEPTMLEDLRQGVKPAHILCQTLRHGYATIIGKSRAQLKEMFKPIGKEDWDYFASKQCIWGYCYLMGVKKSISHVFNVSEGTVQMTLEQGEAFRNACFKRYRPDLWHRATEQRLLKQPYPPKMTSPSGHTRRFFGRKQDIVGEALADEPQEVTTYATNQAVFRCWTDPENRYYQTAESANLSGNSNNLAGANSRGRRTKLRVEPMHQVHDEFLSQFKIVDTEWATRKIQSWFDNEITIAGIKIVIPFEGAYGVNWSMDEHAKKGSI